MDSQRLFLKERNKRAGLIIKGVSIVRSLNQALRKYSATEKYVISPKTIKYLEVSETGSAHDGYTK
jgi:hypothetical protein